MTPEEAQSLQLSGRYSELLRAAVREQVRAQRDGRAEDELRWSLWAAKACRYVGRTYEGMAHAAHAAVRARAGGRCDLLSEAVYVQALLLKAEGKLDEAIRRLDRAIETLPPDTPDFMRAVMDLERAELALDAGRPEEAQSAITRGAARAHLIENTRLLAWTLYLRAQLEKPVIAVGMLAGAQVIAQSIGCPELEWQILWRLAERMGKVSDAEGEEDCARRALELLKGMADPLAVEDRDAFWRQGARAAFLEFVRARFGSAFDSGVLAAERLDPSRTRWDPAVLPGFVHESLKAGKNSEVRS